MDRASVVVEEVVMKLAVSWAELLLLQEQRIVGDRQSIEHIKFVLLGKNQCVLDQIVQASLEAGLVEWCRQPMLSSVIEEVRRPDDLMLRIVDDRRLKAIKGKEIGDFLLFVLYDGSVPGHRAVFRTIAKVRLTSTT